MSNSEKLSIAKGLKLILSEAAQRHLYEHAAFQPPLSSQPERQRITTTYYDTPDKILAKHGACLSIRRAGEELVQTVTCRDDDAVNASLSRWEGRCQEDKPDLALFNRTPAAKQMPSSLVTNLQKTLVMEIGRTTRSLKLDHAAVADATLDEGRITAGDTVVRLRELEWKLRSGTAGPLYRLALELHAQAPLTIAVESEEARGYRLATGIAPASEKASDIVLAPDIIAGEGLRQLIESALGHLLLNQPAALAGVIEGVHQMRVAIRRLRAILVLFEPYLEAHAAGRFEEELGRVGQVFGHARDWDVFCTEILPIAFAPSDVCGWLHLLKEPATVCRKAAHAAFQQECTSPRFTALVLGMAAWVEDSRLNASILGDEALSRPLIHLAPKLLNRLADKVDRRGQHIENRSEEELHALRKAFKKLRYGTEFVESVFFHQNEKHFQKCCTRLQEILGTINDAANAEVLAQSLAQGGRADLAPAVGILAKDLEQKWQKSLHDLGEAWKEFQRARRFWS
jgi:inorganic triphosphatase YgiF